MLLDDLLPPNIPENSPIGSPSKGCCESAVVATCEAVRNFEWSIGANSVEIANYLFGAYWPVGGL